MSLTECRSLSRAYFLMGGIIQIEASSPNFVQMTEAVDAAFAEIKRVEKLLSKFLPESEVSTVNRLAAREPVIVSSELFHLLQKVKKYYELTDGLFDPTTGLLTEFWREAERCNHFPSEKEIAKAKLGVGFNYVTLNEKTESVFFEPQELQLDLGAVGKGYGVDRALEILKSYGIEQAVINAGSTIYSLGSNQNAFGIQAPGDESKYFDSVELANEAVSTSGQNERYFEIAGKKYGHLIHPKTGLPHQGKTKSASVVSSSALISDMFATAFFLLPAQAVKKIVMREKKLRAVLLISHWWGNSVARYAGIE